MTARLLFAGGLLRRLPPWLQRTVGARVVQGLADPIDALVLSTLAAVRARFPSSTMTDALARIGAERKIPRGLAESDETFAARVLPWLDAHRGRGGPYALLRQLDAYFQAWLNVPIDCVSYKGNRHVIDAAALVADSAITHDGITWGGDSSGKWARFWVFLYLPSAVVPAPIETVYLVTDTGARIVTDTGAFLVADLSLDATALDAAQIEIFTCVVRAWAAAHIDRATVVLLWGYRRLWNYPQAVPTWATWGGTSTWGEPPTVLEVSP